MLGGGHNDVRQGFQKKLLLENSMFLASVDAVTDEMGAEQARQVLSTMLAVRLFAQIDARWAKYITTYLSERSIAVLLLNSGRYLQLVLEMPDFPARKQ